MYIFIDGNLTRTIFSVGVSTALVLECIPWQGDTSRNREMWNSFV